MLEKYAIVVNCLRIAWSDGIHCYPYLIFGWYCERVYRTVVSLRNFHLLELTDIANLKNAVVAPSVQRYFSII